MTPPPLISIITANHNGARFLPCAVRSVMCQTLTDFEWIVADDASTDDSLSVIAEAASGDTRVRVLTAQRNGGPAKARNRALAAARGAWIVVFDSDDVMACDRLERLILRARADHADIVADNLVVFDDLGDAPDRPFLKGRASREARWISLADYIDSGRMYGRRPGLGYLKPMFRAGILGGLRYREDLRVGEDYDLVVRLLARGARMRLEPEALYRYRRHGSSISAVLKAEHIEQMMAADAALGFEGPEFPAAVQQAQARRRRSLEAALAYDRVIRTLKAHQVWAGLVQSARRPDVWPLLTMPITARAKRLMASF